MKNLALWGILLLIIVAISPACSKGSGSNTECTETGLAFTSSPAVNSTETPAPGPDFPLTVTVTQPIPTAGVTIKVTAKPESPANSTAFFSTTKSTTTSVNNFTITGADVNVLNIVEITVTSNSCATNKASGTYKFSRK